MQKHKINDGKSSNSIENYFDQRSLYGAPICWSKYTTCATFLMRKEDALRSEIEINVLSKHEIYILLCFNDLLCSQ